MVVDQIADPGPGRGVSDLEVVPDDDELGAVRRPGDVLGSFVVEGQCRKGVVSQRRDLHPARARTGQAGAVSGDQAIEAPMSEPLPGIGWPSCVPVVGSQIWIAPSQSTVATRDPSGDHLTVSSQRVRTLRGGAVAPSGPIGQMSKESGPIEARRSTRGDHETPTPNSSGSPRSRRVPPRGGLTGRPFAGSQILSCAASSAVTILRPSGDQVIDEILRSFSAAPDAIGVPDRESRTFHPSPNALVAILAPSGDHTLEPTCSRSALRSALTGRAGWAMARWTARV